MNKIKITDIRFSPKAITILWRLNGIGYATMLYRHSDYSWHPDPGTRACTPAVQEKLQKAVFAYLAERRPYKKTRTVWFAEQ